MLYTVLLEKYSVIKHNIASPFFIMVYIPNRYRKNLESTIRLAKSRGIEVILIKQPLNLSIEGVNWQDDMSQLRQKYAKTTNPELKCRISYYYYSHQAEELAKKYNLLFIDAIPALEGKKEIFLDQVHLSPVGSRALAEIIAKAMKK